MLEQDRWMRCFGLLMNRLANRWKSVSKVIRERKIVGLSNHTMLVARDQTERPIEDSGAPIFDDGTLVGVVLVFRDATRQRAFQRALVESEQRFRAAVDAVQGVRVDQFGARRDARGAERLGCADRTID